MSDFDDDEDLPLRVEGWLNVWEVNDDEEREFFADGRVPSPYWEPSFVVLLEDMGKLTFHGSEEVASQRMCYKRRQHMRLDGGKEEFDRRWGYETLQSIRENANQHRHQHDMDADNHSIASAESFFKARTFQVRNESLPDTSLDKVNSGDERRSSLPLVAAEDDCSVMETSTTSTTSRLVSFFSMRGLRSNLKRTKSVTKLDRKRSGSNASEHDTSLISSRIRTSRSHESLLSNPSAMQAVDLTGREAEVKPIHPSVLSQDHCFHVSTSHGSKYISCRTNEERDKWLSSLKRTIRPNQEHVRRSDSSLLLWIIEAKNVQPKKKYFCEILLDRKLYARTSSKPMADMLFWGEHFEFKDLPFIETITVNMFREADKKKKKDRNVLVCYVNLAVTDIGNRQYLEKWFNANSGTVGKSGKENKSELPLIRMKVRHQTVQILPLDLYKDFTTYLMSDYHSLCEQLEPLMSVREKEEFATILIHAMQKLGCTKDFLCDIVMNEIGRLDNEHLVFRGNSIATKAMEAYMKLVGERYLHDTLGDFVRTLVESEDDCEVDPTKVNNVALLQNHQSSLEMYANMAWVKIIQSYCYFPNELREVFASFRDHCRERGKEDFSDNLISASIFLRFLCPAILSPSLFNLTQEYPHERAARNLTLIAKAVQTLANFTKFGGKEEFMIFMNSFVDREAGNMKMFLRNISSSETDNQFLQYDGYIDLGRELSLLHAILVDCLERNPPASVDTFSRLSAILSTISTALEDPSVGQNHPNRKSQIYYDNMPPGSVSQHSLHTSLSGVQSGLGGFHTVHSAPYLDTSPTQALKDMLRQCGEEDEDLQAFASRAMHHMRETESAPPSLHVQPQNGSDIDVDEFSALYSSTSMTSSMSSSMYSTSTAQNGQADVTDISVGLQGSGNHASIEETWNQIINEAENLNGDYIDLIPFMDEEGHHSSLDMEYQGPNGSQISISQLSNVGSSGYQSFGYSQSSSPVETTSQSEARDPSKSPVINYPLQPLSFSNPLYRHQQLAQHNKQQRHQYVHHSQTVSNKASRQRENSSSSVSSGDEANTVKQDVKSQTPLLTSTIDPLRKLSQLSSSSGSSESLNERSYLGVRQEKTSHSSTVKFSLGSRGTSPAQAQSSPRTQRINSDSRISCPEVPPRPHKLPTRSDSCISGADAGSSPVVPPRPMRTNSYCDSPTTEQRNLGLRPYHLSHSMDFGCLQRHSADQLRRTATDSVIAKTSTPVHKNSGSLGSVQQFTREESFSSFHSSHSHGSLNNRRLSPQSAVHMGISSVQRKLQEQERTKQEYENEVHLLRQQLVEAQVRLQTAEMRLMDHEVETHSLMEEWQSRLAESEQRIRQQQAEKDDQMKSIIERLVTIEAELKKEQADMQKVVNEKQQVIEVQEQRIRTLDNANAKLLQALAELKEHANSNAGNTTAANNKNNNGSLQDGHLSLSGSTGNTVGTPRNGITGSIRQKLTTAELSGFKSSTC